ncbi:MAG: tRNA preQ1(34) S-adenosylmethionine ribosyltransferase-isomerase QueA [Candidatus Omnitrophota bacterium]|nr:tRNA preQ1(34) S-adenosylmethionine ribosyltransferase-isomerase QueA [Candidatus Omnitrophota bacterium]
MLKLSDFDYYLPKELIAQYPLKEREKARLLVLDRKKKSLSHRSFSDIAEYLSSGDLLVLNDTRVLPCRIIGKRITGGKVEVLLLAKEEASKFNCLIRPARVKLHERIIFNGGDLWCDVSGKNQVTFSTCDTSSIYKLGRVPLPPYIKRESEESDNVYYQTVYAKKDGSIASPTAGLHFTRDLLHGISDKVNIAYITLHISYSTFKPVKAADITEHKMDKEFYHIDEITRDLLHKTHDSGKKIFGVGTTSTRALESYSLGEAGSTDLFIYPGFQFKMVDHLITNFHLPKTSLFMLACAFAGTELIKMAYQEAVKEKYRFYSYGDAMLII